jgi:hypothetical protein
MLLCMVDLSLEGIHLFTMLFWMVFTIHHAIWIIFSMLLAVLSNYTGRYSACYSEWYPAWFYNCNQHVTRGKGNIFLTEFEHGVAYWQSLYLPPYTIVFMSYDLRADG